MKSLETSSVEAMAAVHVALHYFGLVHDGIAAAGLALNRQEESMPDCSRTGGSPFKDWGCLSAVQVKRDFGLRGLVPHDHSSRRERDSG